jgi:CheY-like chemotaxis protein
MNYNEDKLSMKKKLKLLILEDDEAIMYVYKCIFSKTFEYELVTCKNDIELYTALDNNSIDLFLIDLGLQQSKDGLQLIKELRQMNKYSFTPIVVVSAYTLLKDERESILAGATKFIRKPFDIKKLMDELTKVTTEQITER